MIGNINGTESVIKLDGGFGEDKGDIDIMENKKLKAFGVISAILMLAGIVADVYAMENGMPSPIWILLIIIQILTGIFSIYYILAGCKKSGGANMFKLFMICFAVYSLLMLVLGEPVGKLDTLVIALAYGLTCVFATALNLGKKKSYILAAVIAVCCLVSFIIACAYVGNGAMVYVMSRAVTLLIGLVMFLMVACKYADKATRGSN